MDDATLQHLLEVIGEEKIAMGTDYPFPLGEDRPREMIESMKELSEKTKMRLLSGTACEWLGIPQHAKAVN